jgi:hypothetical protein
MYVIVWRRGTTTMWLVSVVPQRWGDRSQAMRFETRGDARRAAVAIKLLGDWSIETSAPIAPSPQC